MTSYFEIGGKVVECEVSASGTLGTWTDNVWTKDRFEESATGTPGYWIGDSWYSEKAISEGTHISSEGRGSLARHWVRSVTYPTQRALDEPTGMFSFPTFGVKVHLELIGKQYDYFIKGEDPWINYQD